MGLIEDELDEVKKLCERVIAGTKLVSCVRTMVRAEIKKTEFKKIIICIQFSENYPREPLLLELKSKTLSEKLLYGLTEKCEEEAKKHLGKPQIMKVLTFLKDFIEQNSLCCCYDEINVLKRSLNLERDEIKLKQKSSLIILKVYNANYFLNVKICVGGNYPNECIKYKEVQLTIH